jgi:uncharacterized protein DUF5666
MKHLATVLLLLSLALGSMLAHDKSLHKGKPTEGTITQVTGDRIELKTATGSVNVALTSKTKFERGKQTADRSHLKVGQRVSVFGTKLPNGELVAREVLIGAPSTGDHAGHDTPRKK